MLAAPGKILSHHREGNRVMFHFASGAACAVTVAGPSVVHVRYGETGALAPRRSFAVTLAPESLPEVPFDLRVMEGRYELRTERLTVEVRAVDGADRKSVV